MSEQVEYRIITDGKRFRAQYLNCFQKWEDFEHEHRFCSRVGKAYRWRWIARLKIWQAKRRKRWTDEYSRRERIDRNAVWEKES